MDDNFICGGEKYTLGGQSGDTIALPVSLENLPESIEVEGETLLRKTSFHVSLVCIGRVTEKYGLDVPDLVDNVVRDFCEFVKENHVSFVKYTGEFRFVEYKKRKSVVAMCEISSLNTFFDLINEKYNLSLEYQPTHVSLFTLQQDKAIFLVDSDDLDKMTKVIPAPAGVTL